MRRRVSTSSCLPKSMSLPSRRGFQSSRVETAQAHYRDRMTQAWNDTVAGLMARPVNPMEAWAQGYGYAVDLAQRTILFWDTLRQRGNNYTEHVQQGQPPLLRFEHETVLDGRSFERPVRDVG